MAFSSSSLKDQGESLPVDQMNYEEAFAALEAVVATLESEGQSLDQAMVLFERGQALARYCSNLLDQAELKVRQLSGEELAGPDSPV